MDAREKRKRVMSRSMQLGHCVCDPRQPCPCPLFREQNVCQCAGERLAPAAGGAEAVRLTRFVRSAGCASKISQKDLHQVLSQLPPVSDPRLLVGTATADDAGVFRLTDSVTIVQTVDVFTPGVDDPLLFGRIAACNSLSDVYAMGGTPVTALSIIGFPIYSLPHSVMADILKGGMEVLAEAGTVLLGGHSINDEEVKFGFAVTGVIATDRVVTNAGARPGDRLILTKPLGTGIVSLAQQIGRAAPEAVAAATRSMTTLNRRAAELMVAHGAHAATDITGFGLLGHLCRMAIESRVTAEVWTDRLPLLPGVEGYAAAGMYSGANERNAEFSAPHTRLAGDISEAVRAVLYDAQTSGGLLIAVPPERAAALLAALRASGSAEAAEIGAVTGPSAGHIDVQRAPATGAPTSKEEAVMSAAPDSAHTCCTPAAAASQPAAGAPALTSQFAAYVGATLKPGAVDVVAKELIAVALSLGVHCEPCSRTHIRKALGMGIGWAELEEVAAIALAFGGCRSMVLWQTLRKELA